MNKARREELDRWFLRMFREMGIEPIPLRDSKKKLYRRKSIN